jgi:uncharacterized membrane protein YhiD involved in acid resistance
MTPEILQLGAVAIIFLFAIKEYFSWMKNRKENRNNNKIMEEMLKELRTMNDNHFNSLKTTINQGDNRIVESINSSTTKQIEILAEIKGKLSNKQ